MKTVSTIVRIAVATTALLAFIAVLFCKTSKEEIE